MKRVLMIAVKIVMSRLPIFSELGFLKNFIEIQFYGYYYVIIKSRHTKSGNLGEPIRLWVCHTEITKITEIRIAYSAMWIIAIIVINKFNQ